MSAYIQFFIRSNDNFIPIGYYSRNNTIYEYFQSYAPWDAITVIGRDLLIDISQTIAKDRNLLNKNIDDAKKEKQLIASFNNSVEDKLIAIAEYNQMIAAYEQELKELTFADCFVCVLDDILSNNGNDCIYIGIEVGLPTVSDIV